MKQVIQNYRTGELSVAEVPAPTIEPAFVLVANCASLISAGTERATLAMAKKSLAGKARARPDLVKKVVKQVGKDGLANTVRLVRDRLDAPAALGYSSAGVVVQVGEGVQGLAPGDRVACGGQNYASHAEVVLIPKNLCIPIPTAVSFSDAAYVAVGAIALQGVRQARTQIGENIGVIGLGLIGQLTVQMLRASGCHVYACDLDADRQDLARVHGAAVATSPAALGEIVQSATRGHGLDTVIITAGTKSNEPIELAAELVRKRGCVVAVGVVGLNVPRETFFVKEVDLRRALSTSYGPGRYDEQYEEFGHDYPYAYVRWPEGRNMGAFLDLLATGGVTTEHLTTHTFSIDQAEAAYDIVSSSANASLGVVLEYAETEQIAGRERKIALEPRVVDGATRIALVGAGKHLRDRLLPAIGQVQNATVAAVCNRTGTSASLVGEKVGAEYCTTDFDEILSDDGIDVVIIGTRHDSHAEYTRQALEAGKHVFVEKPLALNLDELELLETTALEARKRGLHLAVGYNRRFSAHALQVKGLFDGRLEPLVMSYRVNAGWIDPSNWVHDRNVGGGRVRGELCHFVDFLQFVSNSQPIRVAANRVGRCGHGVTDDQVICTLEFEDGSIGTIVYTSGGNDGVEKERIEVFGGGKVALCQDFRETRLMPGGKDTKFKTRSIDKGFTEQMRSFFDVVQKGQQPALQVEDIIASTRATLIAAEIIEQGTAGLRDL